MSVLKYRKPDGSIGILGTPASSYVTSVNGKSGSVTGLYDPDNPPPYPVTSVNGQTGAVTIPTPKINGVITSGSLIGIGLQMWKVTLSNISTEVISTDNNYNINGDYTKIYPIAMVKAQFGRGFAGTLSINPNTPALIASFYKDSDSFDFNGDYYIWLYNEDATATWG